MEKLHRIAEYTLKNLHDLKHLISGCGGLNELTE